MKPTTTDDVFDLLDSFVTSAAVGAAMELGLFWLLAERPLAASDVAQALGIPGNRCRYWLQLLNRVGLLEQVSQDYALSSTARATILDTYSQETWAFLARESRERFPVVLNLSRHICEPGSAWAAQGLTPPDYFAQLVESPERAQEFTRALYEVHLPLAEDLANYLDMTGVDRLMDLGGGSGVVSLALLRRYPHLTAVVVDITNVCAVGREIAAENSMADRITYLEADFLRDELPSGFGLILQCDAGVYEEGIFRKLKDSLNPSGRLVIVDQFAPTKGVSPPSHLYWAFQSSLENPNAAFPTVAQVRAELIQAGWQLLSEHILPHSDAPRWSRGWVVIEAHK